MDVKTIKTGFNAIYSRYSINWVVDIIEGFEGENIWDLDEDKQMPPALRDM